METRLLTTETSAYSLDQLVDRLPGKIFLPSDAGYEAARAGWNLMDDKHPDIIVFAETPQDVVEAVNYARINAMPVAIQATGHRETGSAVGTVLINTKRMQDLQVDPETRTARVGAGLKWGPVLVEAQKYGLAPLLGSTTDVGVIGYSLSGGMGWLARKYGMSVDSVLSLDVVTLDGEFRHASEDENADLFWALCGGGGGFGVVTSAVIKLHPVGTVYAGNLFYPAPLAKEVYRRYIQWVKDMPEEMTCSIVSFNFPPVPDVPEPLRGQSFVLVRGAYVGPVEEGEKLLAYWRDWQAPALDDFRARPFTEADAISMDPVDPMPAMLSGEWLTDLTEEAADVLIEHSLSPTGLLFEGGPPAFVFTEVRLAGGAVAKVDPHANAYSHREQKFIWYSVALLADKKLSPMILQRLSDLRKELTPWLSGKVYMNFLEGEEMRQRSRDGYTPENFRKLQKLKGKFDPEYRMISSFDIPPVG